MTWISLIGIMLAVAALIITLAVRTGFRNEFVDTILGANAHVTVYQQSTVGANGQLTNTIEDYLGKASVLGAVPGVTRAAPLVRAQVMANNRDNNAGVEVYGIRREDIMSIPRIADPETGRGDLARFEDGVSIGMQVARELGLLVGDRIKLISPNGVKTAFGTSPRVNTYEVVHIFNSGRYLIDKTRIYMPFPEAQSFFNREGVADEVELFIEDPEAVDDMTLPLLAAGGEGTLIWTWKDSSSGFLNALEIEDTVMFVLMSVLVLIASLNIISGLVMLVKNKTRDIGILRTMGLSQGSIMRVFFICGSLVGLIGTALGVVLGCLFALYFDSILATINELSGGQAWDASVRGVYRLPAELEWQDVMSAVGLSLFLSFGITIFPARRAAGMNPVEALHND